jgi:hypothetical protein
MPYTVDQINAMPEPERTQYIVNYLDPRMIALEESYTRYTLQELIDLGASGIDHHGLPVSGGDLATLIPGDMVWIYYPTHGERHYVEAIGYAAPDDLGSLYFYLDLRRDDLKGKPEK